MPMPFYAYATALIPLISLMLHINNIPHPYLTRWCGYRSGEVFQHIFTCSKTTKEIPGNGVKYVKS